MQNPGACPGEEILSCLRSSANGGGMLERIPRNFLPDCISDARRRAFVREGRWRLAMPCQGPKGCALEVNLCPTSAEK